MSTTNSIDLYSLLPAVYRIRDAERGFPLRAFLGLISTQAQLLKADVDGLWDDLFIETCAPWVIPYIGDLVANNPISEQVASTRADVARTIYYRRRKGTLTMLEQLARDVTGWDAHAVAFFEQLGWSQNLNHLRFQDGVSTAAMDPPAVNRVGTALLRDLDAMDRLDGSFDTTTHSVDVRKIGQFQGWYNIRNVGFFLWRLESFFMQQTTPRLSTIYADGFHFSPIGNSAALFANPAPAPQGTKLVTETQVEAPIRKTAFYFHPGNYYAHDALDPLSLAIYHGPAAIPANLIPLASIVCGNLENWTPPSSGKVAIDVGRGRIAFAPGETPRDGITVSYTYGFSGTMGCGPYDRRSILTVRGDTGPSIPATVANPGSLDQLIRVPSPGINTIAQAIAAWTPALLPRAVIQIEDNRTYEENVAIVFPTVAILPGKTAPALVIQAANLQRPAIIGDVTVQGGTGAEEAVLNGLLIAGNLHAQANVALIEVVHSTLVPGLRLDENGDPESAAVPGVIVDAPADGLQLLIDHSITGPLQLPEGMTGVTVRDSIIDSPAVAREATLVPALVSGSLAAFPTLGSSVKVNVTIGDAGPYIAALTLPAHPTLEDVRGALQDALRAAHPSKAFAEVLVLASSNRLIVLSGAEENLLIEVAGNDHSGATLHLDPASSRQTTAVVSAELSPFPSITAASPSISVMLGTEGTGTVSITTPSSLTQASTELQAAIRAAGTTAGFQNAMVAVAGNQLVILSGDPAGPITFGPAAADATTFVQLGLAARPPAISASPGSDIPGPPATLIRTTIFGEVHVQELFASEVIFTATVAAKRRQSGCVRFSYVPEGSQTPRRYRCQPDLEIGNQTQQAEKTAAQMGTTLSNADRDAIRDDVNAWLQPSFSSLHYGQSAYGQLFVECPAQILTGAEDGSEMGAFCFLKQPQRVTSLQVRLQEYLPFGLEAGLIYVT